MVSTCGSTPGRYTRPSIPKAPRLDPAAAATRGTVSSNRVGIAGLSILPPRASRGGLWSSHRAQRQTTTTMPKSSRPQSTWPHLPRERGVGTGSTWTRRRVSTRDVKTFFYETTQSGRKKTNVVDGPTHHAMMVLFGRESSRGRTRAKAYRRKLKTMRIIIETT